MILLELIFISNATWLTRTILKLLLATQKLSVVSTVEGMGEEATVNQKKGV